MLYHDFLKDKLIDSLRLNFSDKFSSDIIDKSELTIEIPNNKKFGDVSTNVAMVFSKKLGTTPNNLAEKVINELRKMEVIEKIEQVGPGFINIFFKINFWHDQLKVLSKKMESYNYKIKKKKICLEFVSANPTGLMHIGHARGAVLGDTISSVLEEVGHDVVREYYINDAGEQIKVLCNTINHHLNYDNEPINDLKNIYPGEYLKKVSKKMSNLLQKGEKKQLKNESEVVDVVMSDIKNDLREINVGHNYFISEKKISNEKKVCILKNKLEKQRLSYYGYQDKPKSVNNDNWKKKKQLLFKSKNLGDETDRALLKPNGELTYFMSDIIYHQNKIDRNFDTLINIWGVDHSGYVKRLKLALEALNPNKKYNFEIKLTSLVNLIEGEKKKKMSKREGNYITLRDVVKEVGADVIRFMMISRNADKKIDFDFDLVLSKSKDNPVFYVQYAYARCMSLVKIFNKKFDCNFKEIDKNDFDLSHLILDEEKALIKKLCNFFNVIMSSAKYYEPHRVTNYLYEIAKDFHAYWGLGKVDTSKKIIMDENEALSRSRLFLIYAISQIIKKSMDILKINCPESM